VRAEMATTRLRKTFKYPSEDEDSEPEGIDEEEQEKLISEYIEQDAKKNEGYKVMLSPYHLNIQS
jgi:hypothetical protein